MPDPDRSGSAPRGPLSTGARECPSCGQALLPVDRFCVECGASVGAAAATAPAVPARTPVLPSEPALRIRMAAPPAYGAPATPTRLHPPARDELLDRLRRATLGVYDVAGVLGRGGMAVVYLAHEIALDRKVAIKVLAPELMSAEGAMERFRREARTAAQLDHHQHIIPIYRVGPDLRPGEQADLVYFAMKYVAGGSLDAVLRHAGPLPITLAQTILSQVGSALAYAHRRGVVHRDVKPANILLHEEGWSMMGDFGIAKVAQQQGLTITGSTVGTPTYMSPEQCRAREETTGASDQYALGVMAYELICGRPPFVTESLYEMLQAHIAEPPRPARELRPDCPPAVADAIMRMLAKRPEQRWPTTDEAVAALTGTTQPMLGTAEDRVQLIAWARAHTAESPAAEFQTPVSPLPAGRSQEGLPLPALRVFPPTATLAVGQRLQLTALLLDGHGRPPSVPVTWRSDDPGVAFVSADGQVTAYGAGETTVTASIPGQRATATVRIAQTVPS
jgi:serine/threonine-protein kinase